MALDSVMAKAFVRAGYEAEPDLLYVEIARIIVQASRDPAVALRLLRRDESLCARVLSEKIDSVLRDMDAKSLLGGSQRGRASNGQPDPAPIQQSNGEAKARAPVRESASTAVPSSSPPVEHGGGQKTPASNGQVWGAPPCSPSEDGSGQTRTASDGHATRAAPSSPRPVVEPNAIQRAAAHERGAIFAKSIFDTKRMSNGKLYADVRYHEAASLVRDGVRFRRLVEQAGVVNDKQRFMRFRDLLTKSQFAAAFEEDEAACYAS